MVVGLLSLELHVGGARSLKDKRMVLRSLKDRLRRLNVAVAELDHQDLWQRAGLGIVTVGATEALVRRELDAAAEMVERVEPGAIARSEVEFLT
jgi:uncharacterized protein YlxP (DUF503 family)